MIADILREFSTPKEISKVAESLFIHERSISRWKKALEEMGFEFQRIKIAGKVGIKYQISGYPKEFQALVFELASKIIESETKKLFKPKQ